MEKSTIRIRRLLVFFMVMLVLSGITAIPAEQELELLCRFFQPGSRVGAFLDKVYISLHQTNLQYPWLAYGYDWLAFAHIQLAIVFVGPLRDPVRNKWVVQFGMIACVLVLPFALVAGHLRGLPLWWLAIDCSFGLLGILPLLFAWKEINKLENFQTNNI